MKITATLVVLMCAVFTATHFSTARGEYNYSPEEIKKFFACTGPNLEAQFKPCMAAVLKCFAEKDSAVDEACAKAECKVALDWKKVDTCARQAHGAKTK